MRTWGDWLSDEDEWPSNEQVATRLKKEAEKECDRLGHKLTGWLAQQNRFLARCWTCNAAIIITPRKLGNLSMNGEALAFRCHEPKKPVQKKTI